MQTGLFQHKKCGPTAAYRSGLTCLSKEKFSPRTEKGGKGLRKSITTRYFYSTALLLICSIAVMGFIQMYLATGYFREENGTALLETIDNAMLAIRESSDGETLKAIEAAGLDLPAIRRGLILTARASGKKILVADAAGNVALAIPAEYQGMRIPQRVCETVAGKGIYEEMGSLGGVFIGRYYVAGKPLIDDTGALKGFVFAGTSADSLTEYLANLFSTFILSAGLMLMVSSVLSIVLSNRMTTPLRRISEAARKFGGGDFSARVPVEGDDELAQLAETFNTMANSLEKIDQSRRSFMGNIAHELRTPMTTIKGFIDGMLDGTIPPESRDHYLAIVSQESGRLTRLIKNMLDITKLEAGEYQVNAIAYDIWESVTSVAFGVEGRFTEKHIRVTGFAPNKTMVQADPDLVYQVLYNLVDNAVKFCDEGGEVGFSVTQGKGFVTVSVRNTGRAIAPDALPYIFDRFYKEDKSRGLNASGSGLGLHICKVLVNLSGGKIWVDSREGAYTEFFFTLPAPPAASPIRGGKVKED